MCRYRGQAWLRRTYVLSSSEKEQEHLTFLSAVTLEEVKELTAKNRLHSKIMNTEKAFDNLEAVEINRITGKKIVKWYFNTV